MRDEIKSGENRVGNILRIGFWKIVKWINRYGIGLYALVWIATLVFALLGYYYSYIPDHPNLTLDDWKYIVFSALQLIILKPESKDFIPGSTAYIYLDTARWLAVLVVFSTAGMILVNVLSERIKSLALGLIRGHVVICGSGRIGSRFAREFSKKYQVVIVEQDKKCKALEKLTYSGILVVEGNAMDPEVLKKAGVRRAKYLIPALGDDGMNAEVAVQAHRLLKGKSGDPLTCFVHVIDANLCDLLKVKEIEADDDSKMRLEFFNIYESGARILLNDLPVFDERDHPADQSPHMLVIGLGNMGESLILRAAKRWWNNYRRTGRKLYITAVDIDAKEKLRVLGLRYPSLGRFCDLGGLDLDLHEYDFLEAKFLDPPPNKPPIGTIFICVLGDSDGLSTALMLHNRLGDRKLPIIVRLNSDEGMSTLLGHKDRSTAFDNLYAFALWDRTCTMDLVLGGTHEIIAQAIHEQYYLEQRKNVDVGAHRQKLLPWEQLSEADKDGNRDPADHVSIKIKAVLCGISQLTDWEAELFKFTPFETIKLAILEHDRWCRYLAGLGWEPGLRGSAPDYEGKVHPDLVPWAELTDAAKRKDIEAVTKLPTILARVDLRIYRKDLEELIARALNRYETRASPSGAWEKLPAEARKNFLEQARMIKIALEKCDLGITGVVSETQAARVFTPEEQEMVSRAYYDIYFERQLVQAGGGILSIRTWDALSPKGKAEFEERATYRVKMWPGMFSAMGMLIYNRARLQEKYAADLALLKDMRLLEEGPQVQALR